MTEPISSPPPLGEGTVGEGRLEAMSQAVQVQKPTAAPAASFWRPNWEPLAFGPYLGAIPVVIPIYLFALAVNQQYRSWRGRTLVDQLFTMGSGSALAAMLILAGMSLYRGFEYARLTLAYTVIIAFVLMTVERYFLRQYETRLRRRGIGTERVLMVGTGTGSQLLIQRMAMFPQYGFQVSGVLDDRLVVGSSFAGAR